MAVLRLPYGPDVPLGVPSAASFAAAAANVWSRLSDGRLADLRPMQREIIHDGPQTAVYRYLPLAGTPLMQEPVLLVPPLAAPASCFDLRRGCSYVEHLLTGGRPTYLVDYGSIAFADRRLGLEHWIEKVIPDAVDAASRDSGQPVH